MTPADPLIYHITHLSNLPSIIADGCLWCDARRLSQHIANTNIGHLHIKARRRARPVAVAARGTLGDYVPFNFCPRSVMLYVVSRGHDDYRGGEDEIVHLVSRVSRAVATGLPWTFTDRHADLGHALYFDDLTQLDQVRWDVMQRTFWQDVREERQAEFLVHDRFPWAAVAGIGVKSATVEAAVLQVLASATHRPTVLVRPDWYYGSTP